MKYVYKILVIVFLTSFMSMSIEMNELSFINIVFNLTCLGCIFYSFIDLLVTYVTDSSYIDENIPVYDCSQKNKLYNHIRYMPKNTKYYYKEIDDIKNKIVANSPIVNIVTNNIDKINKDENNGNVMIYNSIIKSLSFHNYNISTLNRMLDSFYSIKVNGKKINIIIDYSKLNDDDMLPMNTLEFYIESESKNSKVTFNKKSKNDIKNVDLVSYYASKNRTIS